MCRQNEYAICRPIGYSLEYKCRQKDYIKYRVIKKPLPCGRGFPFILVR